MEDAWIKPQVEMWVAAVGKLAKVAVRYPATAYVGLVWSLQAEWQYLCRVSPRAGPHLQPVEEALRKKFIPTLFGRLGMVMNDDNRRLYSHGVKQGGLNIRNPCDGAAGLHASSKAATAELVKALVDGTRLGLGAHAAAVKDVREAVKAAKIEKE
jgi:hypothetical protein